LKKQAERVIVSTMKLCIIGGSSGLGLGLAHEAGRRGFDVTIVGRDTTKLAKHTFASVKADATSEADIARLLETPYDHVVVTAVDPYYAAARELDYAKAAQFLDSKIKAALLIAKYSTSIRQSLTFTSGVASLRPGPRGSVVAAANGAVDALVKALSLELAPIRVNAVSPGWVDTPIWDVIAASAKTDIHAAKAQQLPVKRIGTVQDMADAYLFLLGNTFTTGTTLVVDGGHRLV
jgi:NAD(P)-dependent dehydrogenase (short-subunit alcohol dehydrogenase family)